MTNILIAVLGKAHGIKGELQLQIFSEDPASLMDYNPLLTKDDKVVTILALRQQGKNWVAKIDNAPDRNAAERLAGTELFLPRRRFLEQLEDDEFYIADLVGMDVFDEEGQKLGVVKAVDNFGAGDLLDILFTATGKRDYLLFTKTTVPSVDPGQRKIIIRMPEWI